MDVCVKGGTNAIVKSTTSSSGRAAEYIPQGGGSPQQSLLPDLPAQQMIAKDDVREPKDACFAGRSRLWRNAAVDFLLSPKSIS